MKRLFIVGALFLGACGSPRPLPIMYGPPSTYQHQEQQRYRPTNEEMYKYVLQLKTMRNCLATLPNAERLIQTSVGKELNMMVQRRIMIGIIGAEKVAYIDGHYVDRKTEEIYKNTAPMSISKKFCNDMKKAAMTDYRKLEKQQYQARQQQRRYQAQLKKERRAREKFYATPEGQKVLAYQRLQAQQQQIQNQRRQPNDLDILRQEVLSGGRSDPLDSYRKHKEAARMFFGTQTTTNCQRTYTGDFECESTTR